MAPRYTTLVQEIPRDSCEGVHCAPPRLPYRTIDGVQPCITKVGSRVEKARFSRWLALYNHPLRGLPVKAEESRWDVAKQSADTELFIDQNVIYMPLLLCLVHFQGFASVSVSELGNEGAIKKFKFKLGVV